MISVYSNQEVRPTLQSEHNGLFLSVTYIGSLFRLFSWGKTRCSQECMVINYGKLVHPENLSAKIKKTIQENAAIQLYKTLSIKKFQINYGSQNIDIV